MKKKLIALVLMLTLALTFGLVACGGDAETPDRRTAVGFGYSHWNGLGVATVTVDANDKIVDVTLDEVFLPYQIKIPAADEIAAWTAAVVTEHTVTPSPNGARNTTQNKYIRIGNRYFEAKDNTDYVDMGTRHAVKYVEIDGPITDLNEYILGEGYGTKTNAMEEFSGSQENARWYYEAARAGNIYVVMEVNASATTLDARFDDVAQAWGGNSNSDTGVRTMFKRNSVYWGVTYDFGLKANMKAIEQFLIERGDANYTWADIQKSSTVRPGGSADYPFWKVGTVVTGATAADFPYYLWVAKTAYNIAISL